MKSFKKSVLTLTNGLKSSTEKKFWGQNFAPLNAPPNIFIKFFYFNPEVAHTLRLHGVKIRKIRAIEYLTLGHL